MLKSLVIVAILFIAQASNSNAQQTFPFWDMRLNLGQSVNFAPTISGIQGESTTVIGGGGNHRAINYLQFAERNDIPCFLEVRKRGGVDPEVPLPPRQGIWNGCGEDGPTNRSRKGVSAELSGPYSFRFVTGVEVCHSNSRRLKGIRLHVHTIDLADTTLALVPASSVASERINCRHWRAPSLCPDNNVAVRIEVHHREEQSMGKTRRGMTGLRVICRPYSITFTR